VCFKSDQQNLEINSKTNREPVGRGQDWGNVMPSVKTSPKPSCCILDELEAGDGFLINAGKEGVSVVQSRENECMNDFIQV